MVCPMGKKPEEKEVGTEYPYQSLYRPWSWIFSSLFNVFLLAFLLGICYYLYRTRKNRKTRHNVTYRTVQMQTSPKEDKKVALVTGGNGILGSELVKSLIADGKYSINSLDILLPEEEKRNEDVFTYIQADITNYDDLCIAFKNVDVVFHCAGLTPVSIRHTSDDYQRVNVEGTENVIKACVECGVKRLIYTSSTSVTVSKDPKVTSIDSDESDPIPSDPLNVYIGTKGQADQLVREANGKGGLVTCVIRPAAFLQNMVSAMSDIPICPKSGGGDFEFSIASTESIVQAHLLAEKKLSECGNEPTLTGKAYNISEANITIPELVQFIASETNTSVTFVPFWIVKFLAVFNEMTYKLTGRVPISDSLSPMNVGHKTHTYVSGQAQKELGWAPGKPWKDVVREMIKQKAGEGNKKDN